MNDYHYDTAHALYDLLREAFPTAIVWARYPPGGDGTMRVGARFWHYDLRSDQPNGVHSFILTAKITGPDALLRLQRNANADGTMHPTSNFTLDQWLRPFHGMMDAYLWVNQLRQEDNYPVELDANIPAGELGFHREFPQAAKLARQWAWVKDARFPRETKTDVQADIYFPDPTSIIVRTPIYDTFHLEFVRLGDEPHTAWGSFAKVRDRQMDTPRLKLIEAICARYLTAQANVPPAPEEEDAPLW